MLDVVWQILSVLGIILLVLLAVLTASVLLVLFFPVTYRAWGRKDAERTELSARANWLFGLMRLKYNYPEPGKLKVKALWITIYDSSAKKESTDQNTHPESITANISDGGKTVHPEESAPMKNTNVAQTFPEPQKKAVSEAAEQEQAESSQVWQQRTQQEEPPESRRTEQSFLSRFYEKFDKIKYTIQTIYDKIKRIWKNISYYMELLNDKDMRLLLSHTKLRLLKVLKSIRPRKLEAEILFGTGSPDTTGYIYGIYGMLMPTLGPSVIVTPDFQNQVLEGHFDASGRIIMAALLWQAFRVAMDRRLRQIFHKLKRHNAENKRSTVQNAVE